MLLDTEKIPDDAVTDKAFEDAIRNCYSPEGKQTRENLCNKYTREINASEAINFKDSLEILYFTEKFLESIENPVYKQGLVTKEAIHKMLVFVTLNEEEKLKWMEMLKKDLKNLGMYFPQ